MSDVVSPTDSSTVPASETASTAVPEAFSSDEATGVSASEQSELHAESAPEDNQQVHEPELPSAQPAMAEFDTTEVNSPEAESHPAASLPAEEVHTPEVVAHEELDQDEEAADTAPHEQDAEATPVAEEVPPPSEKKWYVVKVQSNREDSIKEAIERRVRIERLEEFFGQIVIPVERVTIMRNGKRIVKENKLYPGYLMVEVEYNDRMLYLFRETSGVGDFVGGGSLTQAPQPMKEHEVERMLGRLGQAGDKVVHQKPQFEVSDRVKVKDGVFAGMDGIVKEIIEAKGAVKVEVTIFGRPVPVELEYWQVDHV